MWYTKENILTGKRKDKNVGTGGQRRDPVVAAIAWAEEK